MGFYIRKSINLGAGVRLNLSKSGLGVSAGVRGFRFGMNGRGTYVHMGSGGLYYRKNFSYARSRATRLSAPPAQGAAVRATGLTQDLAPPIDVASSAADKEHILRYFREEMNPGYVAGVVLMALGVISLSQSGVMAILAFVAAVAALIAGFTSASRDVLVYNLEGIALERFEAFVAAFDTYFQAKRSWLYETSTPNFDWKRHAGASHFIKRSLATVTSVEDRRLRTNISVPRLVAGRHRIYFLPDLVVVREPSGVLRAIDYTNLDIDYGASRFIEEEGVPADARVVDQTWRFVRRDGGPDRRFNNNRQIPICLYHQTIFLTAGGASRTLVQSRLADGAAFRTHFKRMREQVLTVSSVGDAPGQLSITYQAA